MSILNVYSALSHPFPHSLVACECIPCAGCSEQGCCEQRTAANEDQKCLLRDHLQPLPLKQCKSTCTSPVSVSRAVAPSQRFRNHEALPSQVVAKESKGKWLAKGTVHKGHIRSLKATV